MNHYEFKKGRRRKLQREFRRNLVAVLIMATLFTSILGSSPFVLRVYAGEMGVSDNEVTENIISEDENEAVENEAVENGTEDEETENESTENEGSSDDIINQETAENINPQNEPVLNVSNVEEGSELAASTEETENLEEDIADNGASGESTNIIPTGHTYEGEDYSIEVVIESYWQNFYHARLMITNTSHEIIHNWGMSFASNDVITNLYNAEEILQEEGLYLLKNTGWNQDILPSQTIVIGYMAQYENTPDVAHDFVFPMAENTVESEAYNIYFNVLESWDTGVAVELVVENHTNEVIEDWAMDFTFDHTIANIWNAEILSREGNHYQLHASDYAANILPGQNAVVGMVITYAEAGFDVNTFGISDVTLREITLAEGSGNGDNGNTEDTGSSGGSAEGDLEGNISDSTVSDNTISDNTTSDNNVSDNTASDNDIMEGVVRMEAAVAGEEIGEIYFKAISSEEEITSTPNGLPCVKNQMLLMADDSITFSEVESYMAGIGAVIVGYTEVTNNYQIEFITDKDVTEIAAYIEALEQESWVEVIGYNLLWLEEPAFCSSDPWHAGDAGSEWTSYQPEGSNWGIEAVDFMGGLINAGAIENANSVSGDIVTGHLTSVRMGVIDNAFDIWNTDLDDNILDTWNNFPSLEVLQAEYEENNVIDHGTHVLGIMAAEFNNGIGISGICVENEVLAYSLRGTPENLPWRWLNKPKHHTFEVMCAIEWMIEQDVRVINYSYHLSAISFAASQTGGDDGTIRRRNSAIDYLQNQSNYIMVCLDDLINFGYDNFLIVSIAGNANTDMFYRTEDSNIFSGYVSYYTFVDNSNFDENIDETTTYGSPSSSASMNNMDYAYADFSSAFNYITPNHACYDQIICVGSLQRPTYDSYNQPVYQIAAHTCSGNRVDILAPGTNIYSNTITGVSTNDCVSKNGTSMAAPFVSGAIGLVYNVCPDISAVEVKELIISSGTNEGLGVPVLNVRRLIESARQLQERKEMCEVEFHITDVSGNAAVGANVEIRYHGAQITDYFNGTRVEDAISNVNVYKNLWTDANGNVTCYLSEGQYYALVTQGEEAGRIYYFKVTSEEIQTTASHEIVIENYAIANPLRVLQVRYGLLNQAIDDVSVVIYEGKNQVTGTPVFSGITEREGRVFFALPEGIYTAVVSRGTTDARYFNIIVSSDYTTYVVYF